MGSHRAYKARFVCYSNTFILFPNYFVLPNSNGQYGKVRESKDVIFDPSIDFKIYVDDEEPYDREFVNTDHYVPFLHRKAAPLELQGELAEPHVEIVEDTFESDFPGRSQVLAPPCEKDQNTPIPSEDVNNENINIVNMPYTDDQNEPVYWYSLQVKNDEYAKVMCESQHYSKLGVPVDPRIPNSFKQAIQI